MLKRGFQIILPYAFKMLFLKSIKKDLCIKFNIALKDT